jgi:nicotinamide riboside kinase
MGGVLKDTIMKIAFTGAQSTGKTTLLTELKSVAPYSYTYTYIDEITRRMIKRGVEINEGGDDMTQLLIINSHLKNILRDDVIMDRCILDGVVYTRYLYNRGQISEWVMDYAEKIFQLIIEKYDYIFYLQPEFAIQYDGVRSTDEDFRDQIAKLFSEYILECEVPVIQLTGTVHERINQIKEAVNE